MAIDMSSLAFPKPGDIEREPETVKVYAGGREVVNLMSIAGKAEYRRRVAEMWERQGRRCCLCLRPLRLGAATFEHEFGRGFSGSIRDDRTTWPDGTWINGAACWNCNGLKGSRRIPYNAPQSRPEASGASDGARARVG